MKCFKFQGECHMARQCLKPKRKRDATWLKEKVLMVETQGNGKVLTEEELEFLADHAIVEGPVTHLVITHNAVYQANDLDAYDSYYDEISTTKAVFMANLSSNGSNVLYEDKNSFAQQDALLLSVFEQLSNQVTKCNKVNNDNMIANETLSAEPERYKERVKLLEERKNMDLGQSAPTVHMLTKPQVPYYNNLKQALGFQNPFYFKKAQQIRPMLYDGNVIAKETNVISIADFEETLMLEEESQSKMFLKQCDPMVLENKFIPIDYVELNRLSEDFGKRFVPQRELSDERFYTLLSTNLLLCLSKLKLLGNFLSRASSKRHDNQKVETHIKRINETSTSESVKKDFDEIETINIEPKHRVTRLIAENEHLKQTYKQLYDSIKPSRAHAKEQTDSLVKQVKNNRETHKYYLKHTMEQATILREVVEQAKPQNPLDSASYSALVKPSTSASGSKHLGNSKTDRISRTPSNNEKNKVEVQSRKVKSKLNKQNHDFKNVCNEHVKHHVKGAHALCSVCNECLFDANHAMCLINHVNSMNVRDKSASKKNKKRKEWKPTGKVFNSVGYKWKPTGRSFTLVGNVCPLTRITATNKVPFRVPIPLEVVAPEHVVTRVYTRRPKVPKSVPNRKRPFVFCTCYGKSKKLSHKPKFEDTNQEKLYLLHMDLCGPIRVTSVNGKKYILVIVDDYSRFTWVKFLASKVKAPNFIIKFLKMIQVRLNAAGRNIRIDNGTEFVNQTLRDYYEQVGISHETSVTTRSKPPPLAPFVPPSRHQWDLVFQLVFDKFYSPPASVASPVHVEEAPVPVESTGSPSSITIVQDAPSPSTSQTTPQSQSQAIPLSAEEESHDIEVAHMSNDPYFGIPIIETVSEESSSSDVVSTTTYKEALTAAYMNMIVYQMDVKMAYLDDILVKRMESCGLVDTPMVEKSKLDKDTQGKAVDPTHYRGMAQPTEKHLHALKRIFRYLRGTVNRGLWYSKDYAITLTAFADADPADCQDTRRSTSRNMQLSGDILVSWSSKRAEKHCDIQYHFIKEQVETEVVKLYFVRTEYQLADIFTKALCQERIEFLIDKPGMRSFTHETLKEQVDEAKE
nr:retrovirus-related Pol polyprotein from transposon TNT 1-94 [Tanacetum cinerariifolium]